MSSETDLCYNSSSTKQMPYSSFQKFNLCSSCRAICSKHPHNMGYGYLYIWKFDYLIKAVFEFEI